MPLIYCMFHTTTLMDISFGIWEQNISINEKFIDILFLFALPIQAQFAMPPPFSLETQEYLVQTSTKPRGQCIGKIDSVLRTLRAKDMYTLCDRIFEFA